MAQVNVTIDGKTYRMACDEGQEAHLENLAMRFDKYVGHLKEGFGEIGAYGQSRRKRDMGQIALILPIPTQIGDFSRIMAPQPNGVTVAHQQQRQCRPP